MFQEIEAPLGEIIIANYELRVFNKDTGKTILDRIINNHKLAVQFFNEQVKIYHNMNIRVTITLYDNDKCTNIEYYDTDDNI